MSNDAQAGGERLTASARGLRLGVVVLLLAGVCASLHAFGGAYSSEFGAFEDEPAHLVTALMIRDWLAGGDYASPMAFAENYYVHYPKVAVGQWPPMFHGVLALWMLVFGTSTLAIASLSTVLATALATLVHVALARRYGTGVGFAAALLYLVTPIARECSASAMTETLVALGAFAAVLAFGRYVEAGAGRARLRFAVAFVVAATATVLTKGSGLALALLPPMFFALAGRWDLLRRPSLWLMGLAVGAFAAPWYLLTVGLSQSTWAGGSSPSIEYVLFAAASYAKWLPGLAGWAGLVLGCIGAVAAWANRRSAPLDAAVFTWVPALLLLHHVVPSSVEERHLSVLAPAWAFLVALGASAIAAKLAPRRVISPALVVACVSVVSLTMAPHPRPKAWAGYGDASRDLLAQVEDVPSRWLMAGDPVGEGLLVAGLALAEPSRPDRVALRASKVLGTANWSGRSYEPRFAAASELERWLLSKGVGLVIVDTTARGTRHWYRHMEQLGEMVDAPGDRGAASTGWSVVGRWDLVRDGQRSEDGLIAYQRSGWELLPLAPLSVEDAMGARVGSVVDAASPADDVIDR